MCFDHVETTIISHTLTPAGYRLGVVTHPRSTIYTIATGLAAISELSPSTPAAVTLNDNGRRHLKVHYGYLSGKVSTLQIFLVQINVIPMQGSTYHMYHMQFFYGCRCVQKVVKSVCRRVNLLTVSLRFCGIANVANSSTSAGTV